MKCVFLLAFMVLNLTFSQSFAQDSVKGKTLFASCISCHGDLGMGSASLKAPKLAGQHDWYIIKQLTEIKSGVRKISDSSPYKGLSDQDIKDLAAYIVTL
ncbi:MAG: cytochrome c [Bacteriovoracaceae bacterium]|nr:cytochrome c [Bacteriovoracaceae bacterium]